MTSAVQLDANRLNAQRSTGPRTLEGKVRSSLNAARHGFTGRLLVGLQYGPFADNADDLHAFVEAVLSELEPRCEQERAEALNIAALYVRRSRLVELEAMALAHGIRTKTLPPKVAESELQLAGANALSSDAFERLPRYEGHLGRELDKGLARYARLQQSRRQKEAAVLGELVGIEPARH